MNPAPGLHNLEVDFDSAATSAMLSNYAIFAYTVGGGTVDTSVAPVGFGLANTELNAATITLPVTTTKAGSFTVTEGTYRIGTGGTAITTTVPNGSGTTIVGGTGGGTGNYWRSQPSDNNIIAYGSLITNMPTGNTTITTVAGNAPGSHWTEAGAVFQTTAVANTAIPINLPFTNFALAAGTSVALNGPGAANIGTVSATGNGSIGGVTNVPSSLTVGGIAGTGAGTITVNNNLGLKFAPSSQVALKINGTTAGTQYDQAVVNGAVDLTGATLSVTTGFSPANGATFKIIDNDGADPVVGTFTGVPQGGIVISGATAYTVSYTGGDGNDVVLTAASAGTATTTTVTANPQATTNGTLVTLTATVAPSPGASGTVSFLDNGTVIPGAGSVALVGGVATFSTSTFSVGTHPITASYSGVVGTFQPSTSSPAVNVVISSGATAPAIGTPVTNGGVTGFTGPQSSRIVSIQVPFDQAVQLGATSGTVDQTAIKLVLHTTGVTYPGVVGTTYGAIPTVTTVLSADKKTATLTFSGPNVETGTNTDGTGDTLSSLVDGVYDIVVDPTKVHPDGVPSVNAGTTNSVTVIHRLYGDTGVPDSTVVGGVTNYSSVVNSLDNIDFRTAFNKPVGSGYVPYLDFDGSGAINSNDNIAFRTRFNKTLTWSV